MQTGEFSARFLLKLPVDFSNIPIYLLKVSPFIQIVTYKYLVHIMDTHCKYAADVIVARQIVKLRQLL